MECPQCNVTMTKAFIETETQYGWKGAWLCGCKKEDYERDIETEEDIIKAIKPALDYFPKEKILLTSECGFGHVPIDIVRNKIKMLVSVAKKL